MYVFSLYPLIFTIIFSINCLKIVNNVHQNLSQSTVTPYHCLFCTTNSPKPKYILIYNDLKQTKAADPHSGEADTREGFASN